LVATALENIGVRARSWLAWQLPIEVSDNHKDADILSINTQILDDCLANNIIPVVAGFQGVRDNKLYTLGRGGTDTTAVAIAAALDADKCYIYTDVEGVFSSDPRMVPKVSKLDRISYLEMLELAENGAKVLHPKAVKTAMEKHVEVEVLSTFTNRQGSVVLKSDESSSKGNLKGISIDSSLVHVAIEGELDNLKEATEQKFVDLGIYIKSLNQVSEGTKRYVNIISKLDNVELIESVFANSEFSKCVCDISKNISLICLVGDRFANDKYNVEKVFEILNDENIDILSTEISDISMKLVLSSADVVSAVRKIHTLFGLDIDTKKEELDEQIN
jgi:aspartate kinase